MTYLGHVENGVVVVDGQIVLPEGAQVRIDLLGEKCEENLAAENSTLFDRLKSVAGKAKGLPADASSQVDHYLYGQPKK